MNNTISTTIVGNELNINNNFKFGCKYMQKLVHNLFTLCTQFSNLYLLGKCPRGRAGVGQVSWTPTQNMLFFFLCKSFLTKWSVQGSSILPNVLALSWVTYQPPSKRVRISWSCQYICTLSIYPLISWSETHMVWLKIRRKTNSKILLFCHYAVAS